MTEFVIRHYGWTSKYESWRKMQDAESAMKYLEERNFKILGCTASEHFFMTGAWRETEHMVFCLVDADPFVDKRGVIIFPDPFSHPENINRPCGLLIYLKPFAKGPDGEEWKLDGTAPVQISDENIEFARMFFHRVQDATRFCCFLEQLPPVWQKPEL